MNNFKGLRPPAAGPLLGTWLRWLVLYVFCVVLGASRLRKHVIYEVLWHGISKNLGLAAFWGPKTQPNRGFGGSEASTLRNLRWFGSSGTMVLRLRRRETTYFTWFWDIWGSKIDPRGPPEAPRKPRRPPGGSQEAPEAENSAKTAYLYVFYVVSGEPINRSPRLLDGNRHG